MSEAQRDRTEDDERETGTPGKDGANSGPVPQVDAGHGRESRGGHAPGEDGQYSRDQKC